MAKNDEQQNGGDGGTQQVEQAVKEIDAKGYQGWTPDPTPNENYTLKGRASGAPVPETDPKLMAQAREASFTDGSEQQQ